MTTIAWYSRIALVCLFVLFAGAIGAERKHVTLPMDFRSPSVNGHSCYGHLTARFAPKRTLVGLALKLGTGGLRPSRFRGFR